MRSFLAPLIAAAFVSQAQAQPPEPLKRTPIATYDLAPDKAVARVVVVRLDFKPGQTTGRHLHPVPVVGDVIEGAFVVKVEGQPEKHYTAGQSIYEPANTVIERYDNASSSKPAVLVAHYLAGAGQTELIRFLPKP